MAELSFSEIAKWVSATDGEYTKCDDSVEGTIWSSTALWQNCGTYALDNTYSERVYDNPYERLNVLYKAADPSAGNWIAYYDPVFPCKVMITFEEMIHDRESKSRIELCWLSRGSDNDYYYAYLNHPAGNSLELYTSAYNYTTLKDSDSTTVTGIPYTLKTSRLTIDHAAPASKKWNRSVTLESRDNSVSAAYSVDSSSTMCLASQHAIFFTGKLDIYTITVKVWRIDGTVHTETLYPITNGTKYAFRRSSDTIAAINAGTATKYFVTE